MKKSSRIRGLVLMLLGAALLLANLGAPRISALHGLDVLKLVACGMLLGIGLASLMESLHFGTSTVQREDRS
jgi:hypothetical protein